MQTETVVLINTYVYIYTYIHVTTKKWKGGHAFERKQEVCGGEWREERGKMI